MAEEKGVALAILGIVAVIAVVGLIMLFNGASSSVVAGSYDNPKLYTRQSQIGYWAGAADVENPYYGYAYETYAGVSDDRTAVGDDTSSGGAWDESNVYGESPYDTARETGSGAAEGARHAPTYKRAPESIPSGQNDACGGCPYGSFCQPNPERAVGWQDVAGYPGCYVITESI